MPSPAREESNGERGQAKDGAAERGDDAGGRLVYDLYRLRDRKLLLEDRKRLCALALGTALLGILLMIIHAEMCPFVYKPVG
uniref:Uncharacterized protein n=1 Tax=Acanthochromis polyacanthus TaxID=80966 RepID=A0A3Q1ENC4_9TELE